MIEKTVYECENCTDWFEDKDNITTCEYCGKEICYGCTRYTFIGMKKVCKECYLKD